MSSVLLAGAFGQSNPGDEALLSAFAASLEGHTLTATTADPAATEAAHGVSTVASGDRRAVARALRDNDAVVFAGGTVFKTLHASSRRPPLGLLRNSLGMATAARALRKPLALVGVGTGALPTRASRSLAAAIVRRADLLVLRDAESAHALASAGAPAPLRVGADVSWTQVQTPPAPSQGGDTIIVALSHLAGGAGLARRLALVLNPVLRTGLRVRLQPWQVTAGATTDDMDLALDVARRLDGDVEIVPPPADLADARDLFVGARLIVAMRFHAIVAAAAAGAPTVAIAHELKLAGLARRLGQSTVSPVGPPELLTQAILSSLDSAPAAAQAIEAERRRADETMALLRVLLSGGRCDESIAPSGLELVPEGWIA